MPHNFLNQKGFASHVFLVVGTLLILGLLLGSNPNISNLASNKDVQGVLIAKGGDSGSGSSGSGSSGSGSDNSGSSSSGSSDSGSSDSKSSDSGSSNSGSGSDSGSGGSGSTSTKTVTSEGTKIKTQTQKDKQKTEIKFSETEKIKTRVEDDRTRIDVYSGGVKVRYEVRNGRVVVKAETEEGEDVPEQELFKVATSGGSLLVTKNNVGAVSKFPLQVDLATNKLIASTSAGSKVVTVLPDAAVQNMLAANIISRLSNEQLVNQAQSGGLTNISDVIALGEKNGVPVYEIQGLKEHKLLGFIPVTTSVTAIVSTQTGSLVSTTQSFFARLIDALSI